MYADVLPVRMLGEEDSLFSEDGHTDVHSLQKVRINSVRLTSASSKKGF